MQPSYRDRVKAIYDHYAPEKVHTVDSALKRYEGHEDALIETLVQRYGPEPTAAPSSTYGQTPELRLNRQDSNFFGDMQQSVVFSAAGDQTPPIGRGGNVTVVPPQNDPYQSIRNMIKDTGFACREHERQWESAWMGKIPYRSFKKDWDEEGTVLLDSHGQKLSSHARPIRRWQKRYFVLVPPFFYYFEDNKPTSVCKGALYMDRAEVEETTQEGTEKKIIRVTSRVLKKPAELDASGQYSTFEIKFDSEKQQQTWLAALQQVSQIAPQVPQQSAMARQNTANMASMLASPRMSVAGPSFYNSPSGLQSPLNPNLNPRHSAAANSPAATPSAADANAATPAGTNLAAPVATATGVNDRLSVEISAEDIRRRVERLMAQRDPRRMNELLVELLTEQVKNPNVWWHFMNKVEEEEPIPPLTPQQQAMLSYQQQQQAALGLTAAVGASPVPQQERSSSQGATAGEGAEQNQPSPRAYASAANAAMDMQAMQRIGQNYMNAGDPMGQHAALAMAGPASPIQDANWQARLDRLRARKNAVERILHDVPGA